MYQLHIIRCDAIIASVLRRVKIEDICEMITPATTPNIVLFLLTRRYKRTSTCQNTYVVVYTVRHVSRTLSMIGVVLWDLWDQRTVIKLYNILMNIRFELLFYISLYFRDLIVWKWYKTTAHPRTVGLVREQGVITPSKCDTMPAGYWCEMYRYYRYESQATSWVDDCQNMDQDWWSVSYGRWH